MHVGGNQWGHFILFILALPVILVVHRVQACRTGSGSECEKASFVPGHNLAGEGFDVVRMRRTGAYVINVKAHLADNHTCTLCPNRFQQGEVKTVEPAAFSFFFFLTVIPLSKLDSLPFKPSVFLYLPLLYYSSFLLTISVLHLYPIELPVFLFCSDSEASCCSARLASLQPLQ